VVVVVMVRTAGRRAERGGEDRDGHEKSAPDLGHRRCGLRSDWYFLH